MNANVKQENSPRDPWTSWRERPAAPDDVCRALANGSTLKQWTQSYNFDYFEVAHWLLDNPIRACNYERSLQIYAHYLRDEILEIADDSSQDLITDAKGKTTLNHAHFRRQGRQIEARKAIIRQITTGQRSAQSKSGKNAQPSLHMQFLKLSEAALSRKSEAAQPVPTTPAYDPAPPPLSAATRQFGAASGILSPPNPNPNPNLLAIPSAPTHAVGMASTPSPSAGSASASAASISVKGRIEMETQGDTAPSIPSPLSPIPSVSVLPPTNHEPQTTNQPTKQAPKSTSNGILPKVDWHKLIGVRPLSAFLVLLWFFVSNFALNLHTSIHSLSAPIKDGIHDELPFPFREIGEIRVCVSSCLTLLPPSGFQLSPSASSRNPASHSRRSRDAPVDLPDDA